MFSNGFSFSKETAFETARILDCAWKEKKGIFADYRNAQMPEATLPKGMEKGSREHALYLLYVSSANYTTNSDTLFRRMRGLYDESPEFFDPKYVRRIDDDQLKPFIKKIQHYPNQMLIRWRKDSEYLRKFDDDPRNIVKKVNRMRSKEPKAVLLAREIDKLEGFGLKQSSLLTYWYKKYSIGNVEDIDVMQDLHIPVDIHVKRLSVMRGVAGFDGQVREDAFGDYLLNQYKGFFKERLDIDPFAYQEQLWVLGSQACSKKPYCRSKCVFNEPCRKEMLQIRGPHKTENNHNVKKFIRDGMVKIVPMRPMDDSLDWY